MLLRAAENSWGRQLPNPDLDAFKQNNTKEK